MQPSFRATVSQSVRRHGRMAFAAVVLAGASYFVTGCQSADVNANSSSTTATPAARATFDHEAQSAMTPQTAQARLAEGNHRFVTGASLHRDYPAQVKATSGHQYPFAVVISCIDSRSGPELVFDQGIGDLFVGRVAGNYAPVDLLGSTEYATKVAGAKLVVVLGHTECGAIKGACDNVELGNLTTVMHALQPAVDEAPDPGGE